MNEIFHALSKATTVIMLSISMGLPVFAQRSHGGLTLEKLDFGGLERTYYLHLPPGHKSAATLPVVFALHGGGRRDGDELAKMTGYNTLSDREGFIAVYPNGVDSQWNDGRGKAFRRLKNISGIDDVGFISALIDRIIRDYKGDPSRIYVTGLSNGGMMTLRLGCELGSKLAAIAPVIANIPKNIAGKCQPDSPLPVLLMNGTADPLVPWNGGKVTVFKWTYGDVVSTEETIRFWARHNRCDPIPEVKALPDKDKKDDSTVTVTTYTNKKNGCHVILYAIKGGGHNFPGSDTPDRPRFLGRKNNDIDGAKVIWDFFKHHSKKEPAL